MTQHIDIPPFRCHPLVRGGHAQTVLGTYLPWRKVAYRAVRHPVQLSDGDRVVLHDDCPATWQPGGRVVLMLHGLAGSHQSAYMVRIASKLEYRGVRTFRMDHRGCGAGTDLARNPYNAGRSEDLREVIESISSLCPGSPVTIVGFSLSGNIVLKMLGEDPENVPAAVDSAAAVNAPIELSASVAFIDRMSCKPYDRHFVGLLYDQVMERHSKEANGAQAPFARRPRSLREFDDIYTGPTCGYANGEDYYSRCSAAQFAGGIRIPTLVLAAADDPLVPVASFERVQFANSIQVHVAEGGGHLGYVARGGHDPDRRWMDWRIVDWVKAANREARTNP